MQPFVRVGSKYRRHTISWGQHSDLHLFLKSYVTSNQQVIGKEAKNNTQKFQEENYHGGQFVPETLMTAVIELDKAYR